MKYTDEKFQQLIESYLNQGMSDLERSGFEKMIHEDPELHDEVAFQQATIEAIKKQRVLALKAGLNQVPVSLWSLGLMEAAKIGAIAAGIGLASLGAYIGYNQLRPSANEVAVSQEITSETENASAPEKAEIKQKAAAQPEVTDDTPEPRPAQIYQGGGSDKSEMAAPGSVRRQSKAGETFQNSGLSKSQEAGIQKETELSEPAGKTLQMPATQDILLPEDGITRNTSLESIHPEIVFKKNNKENFHYQFSDSKLVLYADFRDKLYEVLELNQSGKKQMFLAYNGKFFGLNPEQTDISPLREVTDQNLIRLLNEYQNRRN